MDEINAIATEKTDPLCGPSLVQRCDRFKQLNQLGQHIHSDASLIRRFKKAAQFSINGLRHNTELQRLQTVFDCTELENVLHHYPAILEKPFSPYVSVDWSVQRRTDEVVSHFEFLKNRLGKATAEVYRDEGFELFDFIANDSETYTIELFQGFQNEGAIGIRLRNASLQELYTLTFHISQLSELSVYVGALQGPNDQIAERQELITMLTRSLHGLRPKALMVEVLYMVTDALSIPTVFGISNAGHIHQSSHYSDEKRAQMRFDMDELWCEYGASSISKQLFQLPQQPVRRDILSLKSKKRSTYRKRYAWLDDIKLTTATAIGTLVAHDTNTSPNSLLQRAA